MFRIIWPTQLNNTPSALTRLGRVLHWLGTAFALTLFLWVLYVSTNPHFDGGYYQNQPAAGLALAGLFSISTYFAGRALRYILSGE